MICLAGKFFNSEAQTSIDFPFLYLINRFNKIIKQTVGIIGSGSRFGIKLNSHNWFVFKSETLNRMAIPISKSSNNGRNFFLIPDH